MDVFHLEQVLQSTVHDFSAKYMAAGELEALCRGGNGAFPLRTIGVLESTLRDGRYLSETQSLSFYKRVAGVLSAVIRHGNGGPAPAAAFRSLQDTLSTTEGHRHLAAAWALGSLPLGIQCPPHAPDSTPPAPEIAWEEVAARNPFPGRGDCRRAGRSLVLSAPPSPEVLVVKAARRGQDPASLQREAFWMEQVGARRGAFEKRFEVPCPLRFRDAFVFRLRGPAPLEIPEAHPEGYALAFTVHQDYFVYPNHPGPDGLPSPEQCGEGLGRCAYLLGRMSALGFVHTAPLPLFHNRVQQDRREDGGVYLWQRGGRLDRWLHSCLYPNFGVSGVRDFEHVLPAVPGPSALYDHIGTHFLGLTLAAGSYFRFRDPGKIGRDAAGNPWDVRHLFDQDLLEGWIKGILRNYYRGFVGGSLHGTPALDWAGLTERMIDEMGVDRHMEEILRVQDQEQMTEAEFRAFLVRRGWRPAEAASTRRGAADITLLTGPHLGGFNEAISLPELTRFVGTFAALCIGGRHRKEREAAGQDF